MIGKTPKFTFFKSRFLREKLIFFVQFFFFFPDKIRFYYTFDCARFYRIFSQTADLCNIPLYASQYFGKSEDFRKYWGAYTGMLPKSAVCKNIR